jgi:phosphate transport system permease protein
MADALVETTANIEAGARLRSRSEGPEPQERRSSSGDKIFHGLLWACGLTVLALLGLIIALLFQGGLPALLHFGVSFFWSTAWNPVTERFGAGVMIYGTVLTSILAVLIAVPMSFGIAFFLTDIAPPAFRKPIGIAIQLLAAVPSIIFGMWGFFVVVPLIARYVQPPIIDTFGQIPLVGALFSGAPLGFGVLTASVILAIMIIPFISAMFVEIIESAPAMLKESAYGVGATTYEVFRNVSVPYGKTAMVGAIMLGLGRALGETMAVTFVIGNATRISASLFDPGATIASTIANQFNEAGLGSLLRYSLLELGFILFVISFIVLATSRALVRGGIKA